MSKLLSTSILSASVALTSLAAEQPNPVLYVNGPKIFVAIPGGGRLLSIEPLVFGPNYGWSGVNGKYAEKDGGAETGISGEITNTDKIKFGGRIRITPEGKRKFTVNGVFNVAQDTDLKFATLWTTPGPRFQGPGRLTWIDGDGKETVDSSPPNNGNPADMADVKQFVIRDADGNAITITYDRPRSTPAHGQLRIPMVRDHIKADEPAEWSFTFEFPFDIDMYFTVEKIPDPANIGEWFAWSAKSDSGPSVIGLESLIEAPAGKHGRVRSEGGRLVYNGKPFKLWGVNNCFDYGNAPKKEVADRRAAWFAKYGLNSVRLIQVTNGPGWAGIMSQRSALRFNPDALGRMDYYVHALKEKGIYVSLSTNFGLQIGPDDVPKVPEGTLEPANNIGWARFPDAALWLVPEAQDMQIEQMIMILKHTNPHTGLTYAEDPAVACVCLINENNPYFYSVWGKVNSMPALKKIAGKKFAAWLRQKYATEADMLAAWGPRGGYNCAPDQGTVDEKWDGPIYPFGNPWFWDRVDEGADNSQAFRRGRLIDAALFWEELHLDFFRRFVKAIRDTGYDGELVGGNWTAGAHFPHYLNLLADAEVGWIDRHNYFDGPHSMLSDPGSGSISVGLNTQMDNRPYMMSEWIHTSKPMWGDSTRPSAFDLGAEGPIIHAAYGMGLQGWDASYIFENGNDGVFRNVLREMWDMTQPNIIGTFPAAARMVLRDDVKESELLFTRNVHWDSLRKGLVSFNDTFTQDADVKNANSDTLPQRLLAVGRMVVKLNDEPAPTETVDPAQFMKDGKYVSATGELEWKPGETRGRNGWLTVNTPNTQAMAGFTKGEPMRLADVDIQTSNDFAVIYVSSLDNVKPIAEAQNLLITVMAKIRNTNQKTVGFSSIDWGVGPILLEPVVAEITLKRPGAFTVHILDQDGRRTGDTLPVNGRVITFDTAVDKTIYYEIEFK